MAGGKTSNKPSSPPRADFDEIEAAVMETARGRWFLAEYARRHRASDTASVLEALARLEAGIAASLERAGTEPTTPIEPALQRVPERKPESVPSDLPAPLTARADDLKAMAEELLRSTSIFDWVGTSASGTQEEPETDTWVPEDVKSPRASPAIAADEPEEEAEIEDEDLAAWEAELTVRSEPLPPPRAAPPPLPRIEPLAPPRVETLPSQRIVTPNPPRGAIPPSPPVRSAPPPPPRSEPAPPRNAPLPPPPRPAVSASLDMPEIAPGPVERPRDARPPLTANRPHPPAFSEARPLPPGPRVDDPTLTMTRDEKLALFS